MGEIGSEWLELIRDAQSKNMDPKSIAAVDSESVAAVERAKERGIDLDALDALTADELTLIKQIRDKRQQNAPGVDQLLAMLNVL